jgi:tRNA A37 threonylcarbamoyladenosine synthetase subunit TsaC/SUA5/YrdC
MAKVISIHPENPQKKMILQVVEVLEAGGIIAYPTDSGYALGWISDNTSSFKNFYDLQYHFFLGVFGVNTNYFCHDK